LILATALVDTYVHLDLVLFPGPHANKKIITASSCKAEYIAAFETAKEYIWLCTLLNTIGYHQDLPTIISVKLLSLRLIQVQELEQ
jgi:hypothetical protein